MAKTELKEIEINKIKPNPLQPREHFDREKIQELAESILSNGLINPLQVRKKGNIYEIVAGERRWKASQVAKLKKIPVFIKSYSGEGQMMIESLIENVHREDLEDMEKAKFLEKIAKIKDLYHKETRAFYKKGDINCVELARLIGLSKQHIQRLIDLRHPRFLNLSKAVEKKEITESHFREIKRIEDKKIQERVLDKVKKEDLSSRKTEKLVPLIKKAPEDVKEALLSDEISIEQAERLSSFQSPKAREQALEQVKQHRHIANITPKLMERAKPELTDAVKRQFDTTQRRIFTYLNDAKTSLSKVNNNLKQANLMLSQLMSKSFEYGLDKRTLITTIQQMKSISDRLNEFEIQNDRFDELKETFLERVEDRIEELK